jgi:hypothetical protein
MITSRSLQHLFLCIKVVNIPLKKQELQERTESVLKLDLFVTFLQMQSSVKLCTTTAANVWKPHYIHIFRQHGNTTLSYTH